MTITGFLLGGFETATAGGNSVWRRYAKIHKIILFGRHARGVLVDEPENGCLSDFNILIVVSDEKLTDIANFWYETEQRIARDPSIGRAVNLMVSDLAAINQGLDAGANFFHEIIDRGVLLYEVPGHAFGPLRPLTARAAADLARTYLQRQASSVETKLHLARYAIDKGQELDWPQTAAFNIHQAVEAAYLAVLLVTGFYAPRSHNIAFLRGLAEALAPALHSVWPRESRAQRKPFEKLRRAYVDARYNQAAYKITTTELVDLVMRADDLFNQVQVICGQQLATLILEAEALPQDVEPASPVRPASHLIQPEVWD